MESNSDMIVRIGMIGLGYRGMATLRRYQHIPEARFVMLCDSDQSKLQEASHLIQQRGMKAKCVDTAEEVCRCTDVDLVYICTNWDSHASLAMLALKYNKDVGLEIPCATTLADCYDLQEAAKRSKGRVFMLENCCFDPFHLGILGIQSRGMFGELTHLEGAYIHYLAEKATTGLQGNPYPTHGIGPITQLLGADKLCSIISINGKNSINNSLLTTKGGCSILLQYDETTPRPYSRLQLICGTLGFAQKYPQAIIQLGDHVRIGKEAESFIFEFIDDRYKSMISYSEGLGVENVMNYLMDCELMNAVRRLHTYPISLEDALQWSMIVELSSQSASRQGERVLFPSCLLPQM